MFAKFLILLTFPIACIFAHDAESLNSPSESTPVPTIVQIVTQQPEAIQHYDKIEKKLYLKAEKIFHTNAGLALYSGDSVIFLPRLSVDHMGIIFPVAIVWMITILYVLSLNVAQRGGSPKPGVTYAQYVEPRESKSTV